MVTWRWQVRDRSPLGHEPSLRATPHSAPPRKEVSCAHTTCTLTQKNGHARLRDAQCATAQHTLARNTFNYFIASLLHCFIASLLHCFIASLLHFCIVSLLPYFTTSLLHHFTTSSHHHSITSPPYYLITLLPYYLITLLLYYFNTLIPHYLITLLLHYFITGCCGGLDIFVPK